MENKLKYGFLFIAILFLFVFVGSNLVVAKQTQLGNGMKIIFSDPEVSSFNLPLMGEPIPGAEIYVELEPEDEPIVNSQTDGSGEVNFSIQIPPSPNQPNQPHTPKGIKLSFQFPEKIWKFIAEKYKRKDLFGAYSFQIVIKIGKTKYVQEFSRTIKSDMDMKAMATRKQGPIKQPFSSGESITNNTKEVIKVPCSITLLCLNVN